MEDRGDSTGRIEENDDIAEANNIAVRATRFRVTIQLQFFFFQYYYTPLF